MEYRTRTRINCIRSPYKLVHLTINGEKIVTTDNHPFYVQGRGFIKAEVVNYKDLLESGSYAGAREKGLVRMEGKEYVVKDGDVILFRFNV